MLGSCLIGTGAALGAEASTTIHSQLTAWDMLGMWEGVALSDRPGGLPIAQETAQGTELGGGREDDGKKEAETTKSTTFSSPSFHRASVEASRANIP